MAQDNGGAHSPDARSRRTTVHSLFPLVMIAAAFFLPTLRTCNGVETPLHYASNDQVWIVPMYAGAGLLAAATIVALVSGQAPAQRIRIGGRVIAGCNGVVSLLAVGAAFLAWFSEKEQQGMLLTAATVLTLMLGLGLAKAMATRRHGGWEGWVGVLSTFWFWSAPVPAFLLLVRTDEGSWKNFGSGAFVLLAAFAWLGIVVCHRALANRRTLAE